MRTDDLAGAGIFTFNSMLNNKNDDLVIRFGGNSHPELPARMG